LNKISRERVSLKNLVLYQGVS